MDLFPVPTWPFFKAFGGFELAKMGQLQATTAYNYLCEHCLCAWSLWVEPAGSGPSLSGAGVTFLATRLSMSGGGILAFALILVNASLISLAFSRAPLAINSITCTPNHNSEVGHSRQTVPDKQCAPLSPTPGTLGHPQTHGSTKAAHATAACAHTPPAGPRGLDSHQHG